MRFISRLALLAGLASSSALAYAQFVWQSPISGPWSVGTNWVGLSSPTTGSGASDVFIDFAPYALTGGPGNFTTTLNYSVAIRALFTRANFELAGATLNLNSPSQIDGSFTMQSGAISGGTVTFNGSSLFPGTVDRLLNSGNYRFMGAVDYAGGNLHCVNSSLEVYGFVTSSDGIWRDGVLTFASTAVLRKDKGAGTLSLAAPYSGGPSSINANGLIESQSGTIELRNDGIHSGTLYGNGGTVSLPVGTQQFLAGSKLRDDVQITGAYCILPTSSATLEILGTPQFQAGSLTGSGRLIGSGTLQLSTNATRLISGTLTNQIHIAFLDGIVSAVNGTFDNEQSLTVDGPRTWRDGIFNNYGSLVKTGNGNAVMGVQHYGGPIAFNNFGSVQALEDDLTIVANGTHTGSFDAPGGSITFASSTHRFDPGHQLKSNIILGSGTFQVPADQSLNCLGNVRFLSGTLTNVGSSPSVISGTGSLDIEGSVTLGGQQVMTTVLNWNSGIVSAVNATVSNRGTVNVNSEGDWRDGVFNNEGTLLKGSPGISNFAMAYFGGPRQMNNSGVVRVEDGVLRVLAPGTHTGWFLGYGGQIEFPNSSQTFNNGSKLSGDVSLNGTIATIPDGQSLVLENTLWSAGSLRGGGTLAGSGPMTWTQTATLEGSLTSNVPIFFNAGLRNAVNSTFTNVGVITFDGTGGDCTWRDGILNNQGTIKAVAGTIFLTLPYYGGAVELRNSGQVIADGALINVNGAGTHSGRFTTANSGAVRFVQGTHTMREGSVLGTGTATATPMVTNESVAIDGESVWESSTWSGTGRVRGGTWRWTTGAPKVLGGHLIAEADISHEGGLISAVNAQFTNRGVATVGDGLMWRDGLWFNEGTIRKISGSGTMAFGTNYYGGPRSLTNTGRLLSSSGVLSIETPLTNYTSATQTMTGGTYAASSTGKLVLPIGPVATNTARFELDGASALITQSNGSTSALATLTDNRGGLDLTGGALLSLPGMLSNSGDVLIGVGSSLSCVAPYTQTSGETRVNGTLPVTGVFQGGAVSGLGTVSGSALTSTTLSPGDPLGTLAVSGNLSMTNSTLDVQVVNATPGWFDRVAVSGTATISGGTLMADAAPSTTVLAGTTADIMTASSRVGTYTNHPNPLDWAVTYGPTYVRLTALRNVVGPTQLTGTVDLDGWAVTYTSVPVTIELRQGGALIETQTVSLDANRTYRFNTRRRGVYEVSATGAHWLVRHYPTSIVITDAGLSDIDFSLVNGDIDKDNEIGIGDYAILSAAYNSVLGDENYEPNADLNGDEAIDIADYAILSTNYGSIGDD